MKKTLVCLCLFWSAAPGEEDGFRERFADPLTRAASLAELAPGTRDAFFYTALDHQLAGREAEFLAVVESWKAAAAAEGSTVSPAGYEVLENRQLLLSYEQDPEASLAGLIRTLGLRFDDVRPDVDAVVAALPTRIDPAGISDEAFEAVLRQRRQGLEYQSMRGERLWRELDALEEFDGAKVNWFLSNFPRADHPAVPALAARGMELNPPVPFGSVNLHRRMTWTQLDDLPILKPELWGNEEFVLAYLTKMRPGVETDFARDREAHAEHLTKCKKLAVLLPAALNPLKAHALFHHLRLQRERGNFPQEDFLAFLALPRASHGLLRVDGQESGRVAADLGKDFRATTGCEPVGDDTWLIEELLRHFLSEEDSAEVFAPWIEETALAKTHARARLLAGGDPARWGGLLEAEEARALREETWIRFAPGAPDLLGSDEEVDLAVDLKNTPEVLIRIYELDLPAHLSRHGGEPVVDLDLEGLVPHHERRLAFAHSPWLLHRESLALPELEGGGAWLVELVADQVSARALIRKGRLVPFPERTADGQVVRVFDEGGNPVTDASVSLGRETIAADETGRIFIPNAPGQPATAGIVRAGKLAAPLNIGSRRDSLALEAAFLLDREQLLADMEAQLHVRVRLTNHGHEVPLDRLENPALTLRAELPGEVATEHVIAEGLEPASSMKVPFHVPEGLQNLTLTLSGTVTPLTGGEPERLQAGKSFALNADLNENMIETYFFSPTTEGHRLEARGRNGEPIASRMLQLDFESRNYREPVSLQVRTDDAGRVELGELDGIESVTVRGTGNQSARYVPVSGRLEIPEHLHALAGQVILVPLEIPADGPRRERISLLEIVDGHPVRDHFGQVLIGENWVIIERLTAGDYDFRQGETLTKIRVSGGVASDGLLVSASRILPEYRPALPVIAEAAEEDAMLKVRLAGHAEGTRVSLIGRRYDSGIWDGHQGLRPFGRPVPPVMKPGFTGNGYLTEKRLNDEIRYILNRRAAEVFPGSMLPRPGLLSNRWTGEDLKQGRTDGRGETDGILASPSVRDSDLTGGAAGAGAMKTGTALPQVCDFLGKSSVVLFDLEPDDEGVVSVPLAEFEGAQFVTVVVVDEGSMDLRNVPLAPNDAPLRDRRIARPFEPGAHYLATRNAIALANGAEAEIENLLDADWRAFTTLAEAHQLLYGMTSDERLREFSFLTNWPDLDEARKLELLSKHACHELHLFLARKDRAFFEAHVKPMLESKLEPQFLEDLLLERDLAKYLRPHAWKSLNAAEKALLSQAMPEARERITKELDLRWKLETPSPDEETALFSQTLQGGDLALEDSLGLASRERVVTGVAYLNEKLRRIIIPSIDFENVTVEEAIDFLRMRSVELDNTELDPSKRGVNIVLRTRGAEPPVITELRLRNVPLEVALKYIGDKTRLRMRVDDFAVTLSLMTEVGEDFFTRTYTVPPGFAKALAGGVVEHPDPFLPEQPVPALSPRRPIIELLRMSGVNFPDGASAILSANNTLFVTNTPSELDKIEQLTEAFHSSENLYAPSAAFGDADPFGGGWGEDHVLPRLEAPAEADPFAPAAAGATLAVQRRQAGRFSTFPEQTKLWRESNYYRHRGKSDEALIPLNRFWLDLAAWNGEGAFLSPHFNACHRTGNEALMCLALLDLPFRAERPEIAVEGSTLRVKAREPMLLFYKDTRRTEEVAEESPLLIRQFFHPLEEAMRRENDRQVENPVQGNFRPGTAYGAWMVVTNPAGVERRVDVLAQIPAGSIPLVARPATLSETKTIRPYGVLHFHLAFYFPEEGDFPVHPMHVSEAGTILAVAEERTLRVSRNAGPGDTESWPVVAAEGTNEEVLQRLRTENLNLMDLRAIRWRLKDREFYLAVTEILNARLHFSLPVASYGFHHNDVPSIRDYLENSGITAQFGQWLDSPLLSVRPREHHGWETLEFDPLVNERVHAFAGRSRITHGELREHYQAFLNQLAWKPELSAAEELTLAGFLFLQDRIGEGLAMFDRIDPDELPGRLHYDYLHSVVHFHRETPGEALEIAKNRLPGLPPGLWRDRFAAVMEQAEEIAALAAPAEEENAGEKPLVAPELDLALNADGQLRVRHTNLERAGLQLFHVDLEILFSKDPFLKGEGGNAAHPPIRANEILEVALEEDGETLLDLPQAFRQGNVLVAAESGETRLLEVLDSRTFEIRRQPLERTLQVLDAEGMRPLPKSYVKVFAESRDGGIRFHKDGYTDLRGKFDYISHTGADISEIRRFAVLVSHPELGARTIIYER